MTPRSDGAVTLMLGLIVAMLVLGLWLSHDAPYTFTHGPGCVVHSDVYGY